MSETKCPRCQSPSPERHPAMQFEGEVHLCSHEYHASTDSGRRALAAASRQVEDNAEEAK